MLRLVKMVLSEAWAKKYPVATTISVHGVVSVNFSYWQGFGGHIVAGEVVLSVSGGCESASFHSEAQWPQDNLENYVVEGIADAMHQFSGAPVGLSVTLKSIGWHDVNSSGSGFYFAAREAMFSALRILQVPRSNR
jgi:hypothetical protein